MMIHFACASCGWSASAPEGCEGRTTKCHHCGKPLTVPRAAPQPHTSFPSQERTAIGQQTCVTTNHASALLAIACPTCSRVNPANATYCYYDGRVLTRVREAGPIRPGALPFPVPFSFPDGESCRNFDQLALTCDRRWNEARTFLVNGIWSEFFRKIGRHDLAVAAVQGAKEADPNVGLSYLLELLPTDALRRPSLSLISETEDLGTLKPGEDHPFKVVIGNSGGLLLSGQAATDCDWLCFGDRHGAVSTKLFQTRDDYTLFARVLGNKLRAGQKPLEGQIVIESNGGAKIIAVKAMVPVLPFPNGEHPENVLAGAKSPREVVHKAKAHPLEAAALFEQGAVKAWYTSNGWTYPIQGTQGTGKGAVQQFFEALGLSKPPHLEIDPEQIVCQGEAGRQLTKTVTVSTKEAKYVHAEAHSDQSWIQVQPTRSKGARVTIPLIIEVPPCPGQSLHARVRVQGNGQQRFVVPVTLTVEAATNEQEAEMKDGGRSRRFRVFAGVGAAFLLFLALGLVALFRNRHGSVPSPDKNDSGQSQAARTGTNTGMNTGKKGSPQPPPAQTEAWWKDIPDQKFTACAGELKSNAPADCRAILERLEAKDETDRFAAYKQLAAKLPDLVRNGKTREPLARFLTECCVHEPSDLNLSDVRRALAGLFPKERTGFNPRDKGRELEDALYSRQVLFNAMTHKAVKPERVRFLADVFGMVFGFSIDTSAAVKELLTETEKLLAVRCYRNTAPTATASVEHALTIRALLIEKYPQHLAPSLRIQADADVLVAGLGKGSEALWPRLEPLVTACLESDDASIGRKLINAYTKANAGLARKMVVLLAPRWKEAAAAKATLPEKVAALRKFLNMDVNKISSVPAFRLLLNPIGDADEEASLAVFKALLGESNTFTSEEIDVLIEAVRDAKRRTKVRCFAVVNLGDGKHAARAVPALVGVLREKGDGKLLSLSIQALGRIGDKREDVLNALLALAASAEEEKVRLEALQMLERLDRSVLSADRILERWTAENNSSVRQAWSALLQSRLARLQPEQMKELHPLLRHKDADIVLAGLKVVQAHKEKATDVAAEVADLLEHDEAKVREAVVEALQALGSAAAKARPNLTQLLLKHWDREKASAVRQALGKLLQSRLALLKPEQMKELLPLLRHKDMDLVLVGLKVVQVHKENAADVAEQVVDLLQHGEAKVRETALEALRTLGSSARKALPRLFEVLEKTPKYKRTLLALTVAGLVEKDDIKNMDRLVPFLLEGLHPSALREQEKASEAAINKALLKIGQPAVQGSFTVLTAILNLQFAGGDNVDYRKKLYESLAKLGPTCRSQANYQTLLRLRNREAKKIDNKVTEPATIALKAMDPR